MKWFSLSPQTSRNSLPRKAQSTLNPWVVKAVLCPFIGSMILSGDVPQWQPKNLASLPSESIANKVNRIAAKITVKVYGKNFLGSGIILHRQDGNYLVLTNQHVLRAGEAPFTIQTPDGKIHESTVAISQTPSQDDLALLLFSSDRDKYKTANIGNHSQLKEGELIFAAGFPANSENQNHPSPGLSNFSFTTGKVAVILDKPLQQGYQIAYTNFVTKGMSGGPLLNQQGEVVGVNGRHAYPLWEAPDFYEDNSQPCEPLQDLIIRSSLAIPVAKALALASQENFDVESPTRDLLNLPQNKHLFSTIPTVDSSHLVMEADGISSKLCQ